MTPTQSEIQQHKRLQSDPDKAARCVDALWQTAYHHSDSSTLYAVLDGAKSTKILPLINNSGLENACLFSGKLSYVLRRAAPHLVKLERYHPFTQELMAQCWEHNWGIFLIADANCGLADIRKHCRRIANVSSPSGKSLFFRYYDPNILWPMLPVCSAEELALLFGPIRYILAPQANSETPAFKALYRQPQSLQLVAQDVDASKALGASAEFEAFPYTRAFKVRQAHLDVFEKKADLEFFKSIYKHYRLTYVDDPNKTFQIGNQTVALPAFLWRCYAKGEEYKLENSHDFIVFFHLCSQYGWEFWASEKGRWAHEILSLPRPAPIRIKKIERRLSSLLMERIWS